MREISKYIGILVIGGTRRMEEIRKVTFQVTDRTGKTQHIELKNVLYISDAPNNIISISQWSEDIKDHFRVFYRGSYSIYFWRKY